MSIISWIVLGLIAGTLGKFLMPGKDPGGWLVTIGLGIAGAFVGGFVGSFLGYGAIGGGITMYSIITATAGAALLLTLYRMIRK